mmetsp:Transcript_22791/g.29522  ORF Transcript_22791/g.29522 Transcript_22791/m.29522 type:complete len:125 (-) Transcript_22791:245-619(-)|eukprot:CAMPEP_0197286714 /NCGR_PEP_ID=MMETSP0890-20130614/2310_1 /TAXON_ID=44058 ORGANISM="Aureoumbra lagunensis, Strain CCMP1510" /NCGR_SAMPLE_ID=MMETSP0890 /ASSEMBLY_ACC=CAM_ASM_000533 /LENGTH=124 /DNA_ID=CAMNT_0042755367 /DNA_START=105 /DNA_END=479 /DNA_ORIENTATION=-
MAVGRLWRAQFSRRMHELQIIFDSELSNSEAIRSFMGKNYYELKALNPQFPFLMRPIADREPYIQALYGKGASEYRSLLGKSEEEIEKDMYDLVQLGEKYPKNWGPEDDLPPQVQSAANTRNFF